MRLRCRLRGFRGFRRFRGWWERFLRLTGLSAGGFLSLTALRAEGCGIALRAMSFIILLCRMENQTTGLRPMEMHPFPRLRRYFSTGKHVTGFSGRFAPLRIQFLCHPGGGSLLYAQLLVSFSLSSISGISHLWWLSPLWCLRHHLSPAVRGHNNPYYA